MENGSQKTQIESNETLRQAYVSAYLNPSPETFTKIVNNTKKTKILDIGCGNPPQLSWKLQAGDLWVGCDPAIENRIRDDQIVIQTGDIPVHQESIRIVFSDYVERVPTFTPDFFTCIAPNPKDISAKNEIFTEEIEKFLSESNTQHFIIALDNRTFESQHHKSQAIINIRRWMKNNSFKSVELSGEIESHLNPISKDLGASNNRWLCYRRN